VERLSEKGYEAHSERGFGRCRETKMGGKVPFRCSVRLHRTLLRPFSDSLGRGILRSSHCLRSRKFAALPHSRKSHGQSSRRSEVTLLDRFSLGETRAWGKLAWGHYLRLPARRSLEREECAWNPDLVAGVVRWRCDTLSGRVHSLFGLRRHRLLEEAGG
jgi:hypothetical protein